jgi:site-specific DNA recombinase
MRHKILAYCRVSTDEQAAAIEGSLDNQKYRLKAFVDLKCSQEKNWGAIVEWYVDDGYSAKDTRRPAYQRMMIDLKKKKGNLILITDLSRLSRNIFDFCGLMNNLEKIESQFLSIKEQFDSSTPSGKMMIYNMINLAQFEREQVSERVSLGVHARAMRGLMNGARPILGFDKDPTRPGTYVVNEKEASDVNKIFRHFLNTGSRAKTVKELEREGIKPKLAGLYGKTKISNKWSCQTLGNLLNSAAYIGFHEVNKKNKNRTQDQLKPHQQYRKVKASWPGIILEDDFNKAQRLLEEALKQERTRLDGAKDRAYLLTGILRCGDCGAPLVGQAAHGKTTIVRYYSHTMNKSKSGCKTQRVSADAAEKAVLEYLSENIHEAGYFNKLESTIKNMRNVRSIDLARDKKIAKDELTLIQVKLENLLLMQGQATSQETVKLLLQNFESLSKDKQALESKLNHLNELPNQSDLAKESIIQIKEQLHELEVGFKKASVNMKKRLLKNVFKQLVLSSEGLTIFMPLADGMEVPNHMIKLIKSPDDSGNANSESHSSEDVEPHVKRPAFAITQKASGDDSDLLVLSLGNRKVGAPTRIRGEHSLYCCFY